VNDAQACGVSEGCGDWSVLTTEQSHIGGAEWVMVNDQFFSLGGFLTFLHMFLAISLKKVSLRLGRSMYSFSIRYVILVVMVMILPDHAPARISWGLCVGGR